MTLAWNLVSKHITPHTQLQEKIREKITKLEQHLQHFPPDAVHLLIQLEHHARRGFFSAALTLRLPSNILHSVKEAKGDPIPAFDKAVKALLRELEDFKAELRRESTLRLRGRRVDQRALRTIQFSPEPHPAGPKTLADTLAEMIRRYYGRLLYHAQRELHRDQEDGEVPKGAIKPEVVVDEVVRQALSAPDRKPEEISYRLWLYSLIRRELKRRYRQLRLDGERNVPIEELTREIDQPGSDAGYDVEQPLGIIERELAAPMVPRGDLLPDTHSEDPAAVAEEHDLVDYLHRVTAGWPDKERAVFDLHFLEGFDVDEVALLEGIQPAQAKSMIDEVQGRLRVVLQQATSQWTRSRAGHLQT